MIDLTAHIRPGDTLVWGQTLAERRRRMIEIAHPDQREMLSEGVL